MKAFKKTVIGAAMALALAGGAQASMINVGGVNWDPDYVDAGDYDFMAEFKFTQWYSDVVNNFGDIQNFDEAVNIGTVLGSGGGLLNGTQYYLQGVGEFDRINGGFASGSPYYFMDAGKELTYAFGGIKLIQGTNTFDYSGAWANVYVNSTMPDNYGTPAGSQAEVNDAQSGLLWLELQFTSLGFTDGTVGNGTVSATFDVIGGAAMSNFVPNQVTYTADATFIDARTGLPMTYSSGGNGSVYGNTIPEPGSLALAGLGLLGLGALRRRREAK